MQTMPASVTVNCCPPTVIVPLKACVPLLAPATIPTVPFPDVADGVKVTQLGPLAVHDQPEAGSIDPDHQIESLSNGRHGEERTELEAEADVGSETEGFAGRRDRISLTAPHLVLSGTSECGKHLKKRRFSRGTGLADDHQM